MLKNLDDLQKFNQDRLEAVTASATTWTKGVQAISVENVDYSKKSLEASTLYFEKLMGAKTFDSALQIQSEFAKSFYESFVAEATKLGELYSTLVKDAFKPVNATFAKIEAAE